MPARWFCLRMRLLCCYNRASVSRRRVDRKSGLHLFFPPVFQIRFSTSKQQEIHCDPQSFAVHALIRADNTRCSNNFPHDRGSHRPSSEPIKTVAFRPKGGDHRRGGGSYLTWTDTGLDLAPPTGTGDKSAASTSSILESN